MSDLVEHPSVRMVLRNRVRAALCSVPFCPPLPAEERLLSAMETASPFHAERAAGIRERLCWPWQCERWRVYLGMRRELRRLRRLPEGVPVQLPRGIGRWRDE